jgi:flagellar biosynthesis protein FlhG
VEPNPGAAGAAHPLLRFWSRWRPAAGVPAIGARGVLDEAVVVAVASGKGGTGKSFVATSLAVHLCDHGSRVTLVDCDYGLGNDHLLLGVNPRLTMQHVVEGRASIDQVAERTIYGPRLVPGASGVMSMADLGEARMVALGDALAGLARDQDVLLFDTAAGIAPQSLLTLLAAQVIVLVTNPEIAALTDAYAVVKCLARHPEPPPVGVVVNRVTLPGSGRAAFQRLADVAERFAGRSLQYLGEIPEEPAVMQRRLGDPPLVASHPSCEAMIALRRIRGRLESLAGGLGRKRVSSESGLAARFRRRLR